jgi:hypothetical protein
MSEINTLPVSGHVSGDLHDAFLAALEAYYKRRGGARPATT